jgi:hypothetical protein
MTNPDGPFWELVKAEFRATWCGRWRWLWLCAGVALLGWVGHAWFQVNYWPLRAVPVMGLGIAYLVALVLGSDLLSLSFSTNPQPHREWPGRALLARGLGRLTGIIPFLAILAFCSQFPMELVVTGERVPGQFLARGLECVQILVHAGFLFMVAALLSAVVRRPRRFVVVGMVYAPLFAENRIFRGGTQFGPMPEAFTYSLEAPIREAIADASVALSALWGYDVTTGGCRGCIDYLYGITLPLELTAVMVIGAVIGLVAAHRCRRRPYSISHPAEAMSQTQ